MLIESKWRVTLGDPTAGGVVVLDFGDYTQDEPELNRACQNDIARSLRAQFAKPIRSYNIEHTLHIGRVVVFNTDDEARDFLKSHTAALPYGAAVSLTIEESGKPTVILLNALLQPGYTARTASNQCHFKYTLVGGELQIGGDAPFALTLLSEAAITPLIIPSGFTATVPSGNLLVARSLQVDGNLILTGDLAVIG